MGDTKLSDLRNELKNERKKLVMILNWKTHSLTLKKANAFECPIHEPRDFSKNKRYHDKNRKVSENFRE